MLYFCNENKIFIVKHKINFNSKTEVLKLFKVFIFEANEKISIVRSPLIVENYIFVLSTNGNFC